MSPRAGLWKRYRQGVGVLRPALWNCLLTCLGGSFANQLYEGWSQGSWMSLARRISVGYFGAVVIVLLVFPFLGSRRRPGDPSASEPAVIPLTHSPRN